LVYLHDILPTIAEFAGDAEPKAIDGKSLAPVNRGESDGVRQFAALAYQNAQRSVRDQRWKLMVFPQINTLQLFDLAQDPYETQDLADGNPEQVQRLMQALRKGLDQNGDRQALTLAKPKSASFEIPTVKAYSHSRAGGREQETDDRLTARPWNWRPVCRNGRLAGEALHTGLCPHPS
jgi:hypothetical protein